MKMSVDGPGFTFVFAALLTASAGLAQPSNSLLLSLVPPESLIVAGSIAPLQEHHHGAFLIFTRANTLDIEDFFSLVGADASHEIKQIIFAASAGVDGGDPEHSLLVSGHFDTKRTVGSTTTDRYRGLTIFVVHPFDRERALLRHDRLLAIVDSRLAVFGTARSVKKELDRFLDRTPADNSLIRRLGSLRNQDETWCLVSSPLSGSEVLLVMSKLDPVLAEIRKKSDSILFGIHCGRLIEFEYVLHVSQDAQELPGASQQIEGLFSPANKGLLFVANSSIPLCRFRKF